MPDFTIEPTFKRSEFPTIHLVFFCLMLCSKTGFSQASQLRPAALGPIATEKEKPFDMRKVVRDAHGYVTTSMLTMPMLTMSKRWKLALEAVARERGHSVDAVLEVWSAMQSELASTTRPQGTTQAEVLLSMGQNEAAIKVASSATGFGEEVDPSSPHLGRMSLERLAGLASRIKFEALWSTRREDDQESRSISAKALAQAYKLLTESDDSSDRALGLQLPLLLNGPEDKFSDKNSGILRRLKTEFEQMKSIRNISMGRLADCAFTLAIAHMARSEWDLAEKYFQETLSLGETSFGNDHPYMSVVLRDMARMYKNTNRPHLAKLAAQHAVDIHDKKLADQTRQRGNDYLELGRLLESAGELEAAADYLAKCCEVFGEPAARESDLAISLLFALNFEWQTGRLKKWHQHAIQLTTMLKRDPQIVGPLAPDVTLRLSTNVTALGISEDGVPYSEIAEAGLRMMKDNGPAVGTIADRASLTPAASPANGIEMDSVVSFLEQQFRQGIVPDFLRGRKFELSFLCLMASEKVRDKDWSAAESFFVRAIECAIEQRVQSDHPLPEEAEIAGHLSECLKLNGVPDEQIEERIRSLTRDNGPATRVTDRPARRP